MARVSKAVSCQSAVMRTPPPNDPPVKRRRSEAGDWGKKCLQIGRQCGNSSGDGDVAHYLFRLVATILGIAEDGGGLRIWIDEPVLGNSVSGIEISLGQAILCSARRRDDFNGEARCAFESCRPEYPLTIPKNHHQVRLRDVLLVKIHVEWSADDQSETRFDDCAVKQYVEPVNDDLMHQRRRRRHDDLPLDQLQALVASFALPLEVVVGEGP